MKKLLPLVSSLGFGVALLLPMVTHAAGITMALSPSNLTIKKGSEFSVAVVVTAPASADEFNAAEAVLNFPSSQLSVVSVTKGLALSLWTVEPTFSNTDGTIHFAGGRTSGFRGTTTMVTVRFKVKATGDAQVSLGSGSVLANDGRGTDILASFVPGHYALANASGYISLTGGDLIKLPDDKNPATTADQAVYYFGDDGLRYVFPNSKTYFTWYNDFNNVKEVGAEQLGTIGIGGNVTYRPGLRMIKIESDPKVFVIDRGGVRHNIPSEEVARALYGANWNHMIDDVPDSFFSNYFEGAPLVSGDAWTASVATASVTSISADKVLVAPVEVSINADGSFTPNMITVPRARTARFTNNASTTMRVASDPYPTHTDLPGFDSAYIPSGLNYVYRFTGAGTFGFHNEATTTNTGHVTVTP